MEKETSTENANLLGTLSGVTPTQLIDRYTDQPGELPSALKNDLQNQMARDEHIRAYAFVDLDDHYQLSQSWLVVTNTQLIFAKAAGGEDFELRTWKVVTKQGFRKFQTQLNAWPSQVGHNRHIVRDVNKDLYVIENLLELDHKSQKLFWPLSD